MTFLPKAGKNSRDAKKNGWGTICLLDHLGKAYSRRRMQHYMPKIASRTHRCQFGALPRRGTREAILLVNEVTERFRGTARHKKSYKHTLRKMVVLLRDSEKAFHCIPGDWASNLEGSSSLKLIMEDFHWGTRNQLLGKGGSVSKNLCLSGCDRGQWKVLRFLWHSTTQTWMKSRL